MPPGWWKNETAMVRCLYHGETSPLLLEASLQSWSREPQCLTAEMSHWSTLKAGGKIKGGGMKTADRVHSALKSELRIKR